MIKHELIEEIHESLINGQRKQMVDQINNYGLYDFWPDYNDYLNSIYIDTVSQYKYFTDCTISFNRINNR